MTTVTNELMQVETDITIPFTMVQNEVMDSMSFEKPIDKLVYIALLRFAFGKGSAFPSVPKIALMCASTLNTIRDAIKRLIKMGLVKVEARKNSNGTSSSNLYTISDLTPEMKANSVSIEELYEKAKQKFKKKKKESKAVETVDNSTPAYPSISEGYPSISEVHPSKFEPEEETLNNKQYNNNKQNNNIYQSNSVNNIDSDLNEITDQEMPMIIKKQISVNQKRLIDDNINTYEILAFYKSSDNTVSNDNDFAMILSNVLTKTKGSINSFSAVMKKAIHNWYAEYVGNVAPMYVDEVEEETIESAGIDKDKLPDYLKYDIIGA